MSENTLNLGSNILLCIEIDSDKLDWDAFTALKKQFCGRVIDAVYDDIAVLDLTSAASKGAVYVCGNVGVLFEKRKDLIDEVRVIEEFSWNIDRSSGIRYAALGEVPMNVHNVGVYYRDCLGSEYFERNYFDELQSKHKFQSLTESNKPGTSFRKGIYLSEVENACDSSTFHLLRCSTNLDGPTLGFVDEDREILEKVNSFAQCCFEQKTDLNHVLAQLYENSITVNDVNKAKEHKAKIKSHSDKTKDMPTNGLIAFCTFYSSDIAKYKTTENDRFDRCYKDASVLTQLRFKLKDEARHLPLTKDFRVKLYPNSVFLIPLSTNRLYTHEIVPPTLPVGKFPTRLGYVVRCSKTKAVFKDNSTFILRDGGQAVRLLPPTPEDMGELKRLYQEENITTHQMVYNDIYFSLNEGDYKRPLVE